MFTCGGGGVGMEARVGPLSPLKKLFTLGEGSFFSLLRASLHGGGGGPLAPYGFAFGFAPLPCKYFCRRRWLYSCQYDYSLSEGSFQADVVLLHFAWRVPRINPSHGVRNLWKIQFLIVMTIFQDDFSYFYNSSKVTDLACLARTSRSNNIGVKYTTLICLWKSTSWYIVRNDLQPIYIIGNWTEYGHCPYQLCIVWDLKWLFTQNKIVVTYDVLRKHASKYRKEIDLDLFSTFTCYNVTIVVISPCCQKTTNVTITQEDKAKEQVTYEKMFHFDMSAEFM